MIAVRMDARYRQTIAEAARNGWPASTAPGPAAQPGDAWDPYEVWLTRVRRPRQDVFEGTPGTAATSAAPTR